MLSDYMCPNCGSQDWDTKGQGHSICKFCGQPAPTRVMGDQESLDYEGASSLLRNGEFEEAESRFVDFVSHYPQNASGFWGLVLSRYKVHYEEENEKKIPTCHDVVIRSFTSDSDFKKAVDLADPLTSKFYQEQGNLIEKLQKQYDEIAKNEPPYDIFISYKDTVNGERTQDSRDANELYLYLKSKGYRVFYSRESLKLHGGLNYEPPIFNALNTAKALVLYGTKVDYFRSPWIKNEWQRFYKRVQDKQKQPNALIVTYSKLNPYELPQPLNRMQCLNADERTHYETLLQIISSIMEKEDLLGRGILKVTGTHQTPRKKGGAAPTLRGLGVVETMTISENAKFTMASSYFKQGINDKAQKILAEVLLENPLHSEAILMNFLIEGKLKEIQEISQGTWIKHVKSMVRIDELLSKIPSHKSVDILNLLYQAAIKLWHENSVLALDLSKTLLAYESPSRMNFLNQLMEYASVAMKDASFDLFLEAFDDTQIDLLLNHLDRYLEILLKQQQYSRADHYFSDLMSYDSGYYATSTNQPRLEFLIHQIETSLGGTSLRKEAVNLYQKMVSYSNAPEWMKTKFLAMIYQLIGLKEFSLALPLFPLVVGLGDQRPIVYLRWLQAKLQCQTVYDLMYQPLSLEEQIEYPMIFAGNDSQMADFVVLLSKKQDQYRHYQQTVAAVLKENPNAFIINHGIVTKYNSSIFGFFKGRSPQTSLAVPSGATHFSEQGWKEIPSIETLYLPKSIRFIAHYPQNVTVKTLVVEGNSDLFEGIPHETRSWMLPQKGLGNGVSIELSSVAPTQLTATLIHKFLDSGVDLQDNRSLFNRGICYLVGYGRQIDMGTASSMFTKVTSEDSYLTVIGMTLVAVFSLKPENLTSEILQKLIEIAPHHAFAAYILGKIYSRFGQPLDSLGTQATAWLRAASQLGSIEARKELGSLFIQGRFGTMSLAEAFKELHPFASLTTPLGGEGYVGYAYLTGKGTSKDSKKSLEYLLVAARHNDIEGHFGLGLTYLGQDSDNRQVDLAVTYLKQAANQGHIEAQRTLGSIYQQGKLVPQDLKLSFDYFLQAANQGHLGAQNSIGTFYFSGRGMPRDPNLAFEWYQKAANQGHDIAQFNIGFCYENGFGVKEDPFIAAEWYLKAAEQGNPQSQLKMGELYLKGKGVPMKHPLAVTWFEKAAAQNYAPAMIRLGKCYHFEQGVKLDLKKEFEWYAKAAQLNDADGYYNLSLCYQYGQGVPKNYEKAKYNAQKAMELNHPEARDLYNKL